MPWCSGKVTVPLGCSTALVMNRRPGHAPQPLPPAVDALAGLAAALAEMAIAISAVRPSALLTNLILRNLVIFIGLALPPAGPPTWPAANGSPLFPHPIGGCGGADLTSSRRTHPGTAGLADTEAAR